MIIRSIADLARHLGVPIALADAITLEGIDRHLMAETDCRARLRLAQVEGPDILRSERYRLRFADTQLGPTLTGWRIDRKHSAVRFRDCADLPQEVLRFLDLQAWARPAALTIPLPPEWGPHMEAVRSWLGQRHPEALRWRGASAAAKHQASVTVNVLTPSWRKPGVRILAFVGIGEAATEASQSLAFPFTSEQFDVALLAVEDQIAALLRQADDTHADNADTALDQSE